MAASQQGRFLSVSTPLGADALLLETLTGRESLSQPYRFQLGLLAPASKPLAFDALLGQSATVSMALPSGDPRCVNGIIHRLTEGPQVRGPQGDVTFIRYRAELVPKLWLLTFKSQSRIFQQLTVPDILKQVLSGMDVSWQIQGSFEPRDYCVQYRESDLAFASRLMEEEGIYYYFKHASGGHTLVVANQPQGHVPVPGTAAIPYDTIEGGLRTEGRVTGWEKTQTVCAGKVTLWDACFELPGKNLEAKQNLADSAQAGTVSHKLKIAGSDQLELYDYPGGYAQRFDGVAPGGGDRAGDLNKIFQDGTRTVGLRMQEAAAEAVVVEGRSACPQLTAGHKFTLQQHFDGNGDYVLMAVEHNANLEGVYTSSATEAFAYSNRFHCIPAAVPYRPTRSTPRPRITGTQTATVVGPSGEEIFTDKYGRVKIQFPWDRNGKKDPSSSCWVRVCTLWSGKQWGTLWLPRVGQEVVVAFEEGDPDRPLIVGSVYNAEQMPPFVLPDNRTQSGLRSRSTPNGGTTDSNELRFEDKKGSEDIFFHAQKDFHRVVENDDSLEVKHDQTIIIKNNRTATIQEGNESLTVKKGNRQVELTQGNDTLTIKAGNQTIQISQGKSATEAMQGISLKVGENSVTIDQSGITIKGMTIKLQGQAQVQTQGPIVQVQADGMLKLQGGVVMVN
jgi:type VI secretion system secreted protein VgrG